MALWHPDRRGFIRSGSAAIATALTSRPVFAQAVQPLTFLVIGDWGRHGNADQLRTAKVANELASEGSAFTLTTGDNFYVFGVRSTTSPHWQDSYEKVYSDNLKRNWLATLGNHDYSGDVEAQMRYRSPACHGAREDDGPWGWRMDGRWWDLRLKSFGRDDIHLFMIDTVTWRGKEQFPHSLKGDRIELGDRERQRVWLEQGLKSSNARFKLVVGHHGIYSVGKHGGQMEMKELDDILRAGGASAYINGHDHCLYHIQRGGLDYVCSGAGSQVLTAFTGDARVPGCVLKDFCAEPSTPQTYLPIWRSYFAMGGLAQFVAHRDAIGFRFVTADGMRHPWSFISPRA